MMIKWIDKRSVLKVGKKLYKAGEFVPAEELTEKRIELFESLGQLERVTQIVEKPKRKPRKSKKTDEPEEAEENAGPQE